MNNLSMTSICCDDLHGRVRWPPATRVRQLAILRSACAFWRRRAWITTDPTAELDRPILQVSELASKEKLPIKFLEQILTQLRVGGFVETKRGKLGGYSLAKPATQIKVGAVIRLLDGPLAPIPCVSKTAYERCTCPDEDHCGLRMLMFDVRNALARILDHYTLAQIVDITLRKMRRDKVPVPFARRSFGLEEIISGQVHHSAPSAKQKVTL